MEDWYSPSAWGDIEGFTTQVSVQAGDTLQLKVQSPVSYQVHIYRLGWYGGDGARLMPTSPTTTYPAKTQSPCLNQAATTGLTDCGNWTVTANWTVPTDAVSGLYLAELDQTDGDGLMPYPFVVRNEASHSDVVVQTSDETWQAYNQWGADGVNTGTNLYQGSGPTPDGRAYKVSYNRPMDISGDNGIFGSEYAMISWLERNGYDVSYLSGIDVSTKGSLLLNHKVFMSSGHDEYWNQGQWDNVTAAKVAGVNLAFFSGNEVFWRTRLEPSIDSGAGTVANRTLVTYKMTKMQQYNPDGIADPTGQWTGSWMDPVGAGTGGNMPQNQLTGTLFTANGYRNDAITVGAAYAHLRLWRNTSIASLTGSQVATFPVGTLGYEWDVDANNAVRPPGQIDFSSTTLNLTDGTKLLDNGNTYGNGVATHSLVEYRDPTSHALVFGSGTVGWSWGLDVTHDGNVTTEDVRMQQATVNLLADMGVQPTTRQTTLVAATQSTDTTGPAVTISSPAAAATVPALAPVTIQGTATDSGGGQVARVEVSTDGGSSYQPATGTSSWTFTWTPTALGAAQIKVRAIDDSVNIGTVNTRALTVGAQQCPCVVFPATTTPGTPDAGDGSAVELGAKFRTSAPASVTGIRFYKSTLNTGTHIGNLWTSSGTLLASGTFTGESASGWQTLTFSSPVPVKSNTTYVASYFAPNGHYAADAGFFTNHGAGLAPITELQSGTDGSDGVYHYAAAGGFPSQSYGDGNYYVDAQVDTGSASTTPPSVTSVSPANAATGVAITAPVSATFNEGLDTDTIQATLKDSSNATVPATMTYNAGTHKVTLQPNGQLALGEAYTASVQASDLWGNAMTGPYTWTFTASNTPPSTNCPCSIWGSADTPGTLNTPDTNALTLGTRFKAAVGGWVTGVRFYKGTSNTGTHTGQLWSNTGTLLAAGVFTAETASGWQTLTFDSPVAITANTPYVVSYYAPSGEYSSDANYFTAAHSNYPLTGLADGVSGGNGLYHYGAETTSGTLTQSFPTGSYGASNYWVDPVFSTTEPGGQGQGFAAQRAAEKTTTAGKVSNLSVTFTAPVQPSSVQMSVKSTTPAAEANEGTPLVGAVVYNSKTHTATFKPTGPMVPLAKYQVIVSAVDAKGHPLKTVSWLYQAPKLVLKHTPVKTPTNQNEPASTPPPAASNPIKRGSAVPTGK